MDDRLQQNRKGSNISEKLKTTIVWKREEGGFTTGGRTTNYTGMTFGII